MDIYIVYDGLWIYLYSHGYLYGYLYQDPPVRVPLSGSLFRQCGVVQPGHPLMVYVSLNALIT